MKRNKLHYCKEKDCKNKIHKDTYMKGQGRCRSCSKKGKRHSNYKEGLTLEKSHCIDCNRLLSKNSKYHKYLRCVQCNRNYLGNILSKNNHWKWAGGYPKCIDCGDTLGNYKAKRCNICSNIGKLNPNYIHGKAYEPYSKEFNKKLKNYIRNRDNYICQNCDMTEEEHLIVYGRNLEIHHINYDKQNCKELNLITLCKSCNIRANFNRDYWQNLYKNKINKILKT